MNTFDTLQEVLKDISQEKKELKREISRNVIDGKGNCIRTVFKTTEGGTKYGNNVVPADLGAKVFIEDKEGSELRLSGGKRKIRKVEL